MWGKLNQMVSGDQQKIENLESQLEAEQQRNKAINDQFKKLLKEKEVRTLMLFCKKLNFTLFSKCASVYDEIYIC